jgi:hypothetical protein
MVPRRILKIFPAARARGDSIQEGGCRRLGLHQVEDVYTNVEGMRVGQAAKEAKCSLPQISQPLKRCKGASSDQSHVARWKE